MALDGTETKTYAAGIANHAVGRCTTTAAAAAAQSFNVGFIPRVVRFHNLTDQISYEWFEGMANLSGLKTVAAGTRTLNLTEGPTVGTDGTFTMPAAAMVASKVFAWEARG